jgi:hypothetical protein
MDKIIIEKRIDEKKTNIYGVEKISFCSFLSAMEKYFKNAASIP